MWRSTFTELALGTFLTMVLTGILVEQNREGQLPPAPYYTSATANVLRAQVTDTCTNSLWPSCGGSCPDGGACTSSFSCNPSNPEECTALCVCSGGITTSPSSPATEWGICCGPVPGECLGWMSLNECPHFFHAGDIDCLACGEAAPDCPNGCDDGDVCTTDTCTSGGCTHDPIADCCRNDEECASGDPCWATMCMEGDHRCFGMYVCCDDGDPCTYDAGTSAETCEHYPIEGCAPDCDDDGDPCTSDFYDGMECRHDPIAGCGSSASSEPESSSSESSAMNQQQCMDQHHVPACPPGGACLPSGSHPCTQAIPCCNTGGQYVSPQFGCCGTAPCASSTDTCTLAEQSSSAEPSSSSEPAASSSSSEELVSCCVYTSCFDDVRLSVCNEYGVPAEDPWFGGGNGLCDLNPCGSGAASSDAESSESSSVEPASSAESSAPATSSSEPASSAPTCTKKVSCCFTSGSMQMCVDNMCEEDCKKKGEDAHAYGRDNVCAESGYPQGPFSLFFSRLWASLFGAAINPACPVELTELCCTDPGNADASKRVSKVRMGTCPSSKIVQSASACVEKDCAKISAGSEGTYMGCWWAGEDDAKSDCEARSYQIHSVTGGYCCCPPKEKKNCCRMISTPNKNYKNTKPTDATNQPYTVSWSCTYEGNANGESTTACSTTETVGDVIYHAGTVIPGTAEQCKEKCNGGPDKSMESGCCCNLKSGSLAGTTSLWLSYNSGFDSTGKSPADLCTSYAGTFTKASAMGTKSCDNDFCDPPGWCCTAQGPQKTTKSKCNPDGSSKNDFSARESPLPGFCEKPCCSTEIKDTGCDIMTKAACNAVGGTFVNTAGLCSKAKCPNVVPCCVYEDSIATPGTQIVNCALKNSTECKEQLVGDTCDNISRAELVKRCDNIDKEKVSCCERASESAAWSCSVTKPGDCQSSTNKISLGKATADKCSSDELAQCNKKDTIGCCPVESAAKKDESGNPVWSCITVKKSEEGAKCQKGTTFENGCTDKTQCNQPPKKYVDCCTTSGSCMGLYLEEGKTCDSKNGGNLEFFSKVYESGTCTTLGPDPSCKADEKVSCCNKKGNGWECISAARSTCANVCLPSGDASKCGENEKIPCCTKKNDQWSCAPELKSACKTPASTSSCPSDPTQVQLACGEKVACCVGSGSGEKTCKTDVSNLSLCDSNYPIKTSNSCSELSCKPEGVCCTSNAGKGICSLTAKDKCSGTYRTGYSTCSPNPCELVACCPKSATSGTARCQTDVLAVKSATFCKGDTVHTNNQCPANYKCEDADKWCCGTGLTEKAQCTKISSTTLKQNGGCPLSDLASHNIVYATQFPSETECGKQCPPPEDKRLRYCCPATVPQGGSPYCSAVYLPATGDCSAASGYGTAYVGTAYTAADAHACTAACVNRHAKGKFACCNADSSCSLTSAQECKGKLLTSTTSCSPNPCERVACCVAKESDVLEDKCVTGALRADCNPDKPIGSSCSDSLKQACSGTAQPMVCCLGNGTCTKLVRSECEAKGGISKNLSITSCEPNPCQLVTCCPKDGSACATNVSKSNCDPNKPIGGDVCSEELKLICKAPAQKVACCVDGSCKTDQLRSACDTTKTISTSNSCSAITCGSELPCCLQKSDGSYDCALKESCGSEKALGSKGTACPTDSTSIQSQCKTEKRIACCTDNVCSAVTSKDACQGTTKGDMTANDPCSPNDPCKPAEQVPCCQTSDNKTWTCGDVDKSKCPSQNQVPVCPTDDEGIQSLCGDVATTCCDPTKENENERCSLFLGDKCPVGSPMKKATCDKTCKPDKVACCTEDTTTGGLKCEVPDNPSKCKIKLDGDNKQCTEELTAKCKEPKKSCCSLTYDQSKAQCIPVDVSTETCSWSGKAPFKSLSACKESDCEKKEYRYCCKEESKTCLPVEIAQENKDTEDCAAIPGHTGLVGAPFATEAACTSATGSPCAPEKEKIACCDGGKCTPQFQEKCEKPAKDSTGKIVTLDTEAAKQKTCAVDCPQPVACCGEDRDNPTCETAEDCPEDRRLVGADKKPLTKCPRDFLTRCGQKPTACCGVATRNDTQAPLYSICMDIADLKSGWNDSYKTLISKELGDMQDQTKLDGRKKVCESYNGKSVTVGKVKGTMKTWWAEGTCPSACSEVVAPDKEEKVVCTSLPGPLNLSNCVGCRQISEEEGLAQSLVSPLLASTLLADTSGTSSPVDPLDAIGMEFPDMPSCVGSCPAGTYKRFCCNPATASCSAFLLSVADTNTPEICETKVMVGNGEYAWDDAGSCNDFCGMFKGVAGGGQPSSAGGEASSAAEESSSSAPEKGNCCIEGKGYGLCFKDIDPSTCEYSIIGGSFFGASQCIEYPASGYNCGMDDGGSSSADNQSSSDSSIPPNCGDGTRDEGEECDEGAANSNSPNATCRTNCKAARCGDGIVDNVPSGREAEKCDDGDDCSDGVCNSNTGTATCKTTCKDRNTFFTFGKWLENLRLYAINGTPVSDAPPVNENTQYIIMGVLTFILQ